MTNLRELARGQDCTIRIPGVCNHNTATTVLAHYRLAGTCGTGIKPPDELGAWACSSCHDFVDGRINGGIITTEMMRIRWHAEGVMRTLYKLHQLGYEMRMKK